MPDADFKYSYRGWNEKLLRQAGAEIDFLAIHNAYAPSLVVSGAEKDLRSVYRAMLAAPLLIRQNLRQVEEQNLIGKTPPHLR